MHCINCHIISVSNAQNHILEVKKTVKWDKMITIISRRKSWFVENAQPLVLEEELKTVLNTEQILSSLSANSVAL